MDSSASFHATFFKEELEKFRLRSDNVRLADDKTLDIAGVGDVVLKTSFGTSWILKDVRYIPSLKKRLISIGQLDEEGCYVGFEDQQWKVTKGNLVVAHGNKRGSLYMVEVLSDGINAAIDGGGNAALWHQRLRHITEKGMRILASNGRILDLQKVYPDTMLPLSITVAGRDVTFNEDSLYGANAATNYGNLAKPNQMDQVVLKDSLENLKNKIIVAEHWLSSEIIQSPSGSSYTSEGSEKSESFEDSGRSDEEDFKDGAFSKEGGSETPHVRRSTKVSMAPIRYSPSANYLLMIKNGEPESYSKALSSKESKHRVDYNEIFSLVVKMATLRHLHDTTRGFSVSLDRRKPRMQVEEKFVQIKASTETMIKKLKRQLSQEFEMKDLGIEKQILGMSIIRDKTKGTLRLSKEKYIGKVLEKFNMKDAEARLVGSVMHAMVCTRPYISHTMGVVSRFMSNLDKEHWEVGKWLLRYLKGTSKAALCFSRKKVVLEGFTDSE
uniref:Retrovirus-related Pol polyprotein from transposon TNT 1-94 n=1 Tax=Tanacetum cinerariifolium TaxID=118510 RepID=A0A699J8K6_TANCI|nr:retrovirus-related Pol polyprotein from transposon TNT 1-94 [Tanacetum cinerariifolium]